MVSRLTHSKNWIGIIKKINDNNTKADPLICLVIATGPIVNDYNSRTLINDGTRSLLVASFSNSKRKIKSFTCPVCGKNFEDQLTLDAHKRMEHSSEAESPAGVG